MKENFTADYIRTLMPEEKYNPNVISNISDLQKGIEERASYGFYFIETFIFLKSNMGHSEDMDSIEEYFKENGFEISYTCITPNEQVASYFKIHIAW